VNSSILGQGKDAQYRGADKSLARHEWKNN